MVYNEKRGGWEMPGGGIGRNESIEEAAKREFVEEAGYNIKIVDTKNVGHCFVCAGLLLEKVSVNPEMLSYLFTEVPENTAFDKSEYETVTPWAHNATLFYRGKHKV
jgi:8-oxo-dGTP diphosphatase